MRLSGIHRQKPLPGSLFLLPCLLASLWNDVAEAQTKRFSTNVHGDIVMFGNTLGHDCRAGIPAPIVGTVGACGTAATLTDSAIDILWRADQPQGGATADNTITPDQARSTAILQLPAGASVIHARLYWSAEANAIDTQAIIERPGVFAPMTVTRDAVNGSASIAGNGGAGGTIFYQSTADITALVQKYGAGAYRVGGVGAVSQSDRTQNVTWQAWSAVVVYQDNQLPAHNLTIFDSMAKADMNGAVITAPLNGFVVPSSGFEGKLGFIAYDGDFDSTGDSIAFNSTKLSNQLNPIDNIINATRSVFGVAQTTPGDLPQYDGTPGSMNGIDLDVFDITPQLKAGDTSASINITSTSETVLTGIYWTSISTLFPIFSETNKTFQNLSRSDGSLLPGDLIEYTIVTSNTGTDTGVNVVLTDALPNQLSYVAGTLSINGAAKTDATNDDEADVTAPGGITTLTARLGTGATATAGGTVQVSDAPFTIKFRATIKTGTTGNVQNQAVVTSKGQRAVMQGVMESSTWNSGDGQNPAVPTAFVVGQPTDLQVTIRDNLNGQAAAPNTNIVYTVTVTNAGPNAVVNGSLTHVLPSGATGATWTCSATGGSCPAMNGNNDISTTNLNLPANGVLTYTITVPVGSGGNALVNPTSSITAAPGNGVADTQPANNTASTGATDLSITVTDNLNGMPAQSGMAIVYTVTVNNNGPSAVQNVILSNTLPAGATNVTYACAATSGTCTASGMGGLPQNGGTVAKNGKLTYTVTIPGSTMPPADTAYSVSVNAPPPLVDTDLSNNTASTAGADLQVFVQSNLNGTLPNSGSSVNYTISVINAGPNGVSGAALSNMLPAGLSQVGWLCAGSGGATCAQAMGSGAPNLSNLNLPKNGVLTFTVSGQAPASPAAPFAFSAHIDPPAGVSDPNLNNNTATASVGQRSGADLAVHITKSPSNPAPGEVSTYTVDVSNGGPDSAFNPTVVLTLPQGVNIVMDAAGSGWTCTKSDITYTCTRPDLGPGAAPPIVAQITTPAPASDGGPAPTVVALIGAPQTSDPNFSNNSTVVDASATPVRNSDLALTISKSPNPSPLGSETTYTLQLTNNGPDTALEPVLQFSLPPGTVVTAFVPGAGWNCVQSSLSFTCVRSEAPAGDAPPVVIKAITQIPVDGSMNAGAVVGQVTAVQGRDEKPLNNSAVLSVGNPAATAADLSVRLARAPEPPQDGGTTTYTLTTTNNGPGDANDIVVTLDVPAGSQVISTDFGDWSCRQNLSTFVCSRPRLSQGDAPLIVVTVKLPVLAVNAIRSGVGSAVATVNGANNADPAQDNNVTTLDGIQYKLDGGGFACAYSADRSASATPLLSMLCGLLLLSGLGRLARRRANQRR